MSFAAYSTIVINRITNKALLFSYIVMLLISFVTLLTLSVSFSVIKTRVKHDVNEMCSTADSDFNKVDEMYENANKVLCTFACPCKADAKLWGKKKEEPVVGVIDSIFSGNFGALLFSDEMKTSEKGANNFL